LRPSRWAQEGWTRLQNDTTYQAEFNRRAAEWAVALWERSRASEALTSGLRYLLTQTDARTLAQRIERSVGRDLQYIRVNGAVVGGLAGVVLELMKVSQGFFKM